MSALEKAELHVTLAETVKVAFDLYLQAQGIAPEEHPVSKEEVSIHLVVGHDSVRESVTHSIAHASGAYWPVQEETQQGAIRNHSQDHKAQDRSQRTGSKPLHHSCDS